MRKRAVFEGAHSFGLFEGLEYILSFVTKSVFEGQFRSIARWVITWLMVGLARYPQAWDHTPAYFPMNEGGDGRMAINIDTWTSRRFEETVSGEVHRHLTLSGACNKSKVRAVFGGIERCDTMRDLHLFIIFWHSCVYTYDDLSQMYVASRSFFNGTP